MKQECVNSFHHLQQKGYLKYILIGLGAIFVIIIIIIVIAATSKIDEEKSDINDNIPDNTKSDETKSDDVEEDDTIYGECPEIKYVSEGLSGSGFVYRYWDCCKPSCAWTDNVGFGNEARECDAKMNRITHFNAISKCDGGPSTTCLSQIPFTINGCDNLGFAFASVPGDSSTCGKCFLLEFTGEGKNESRKNHKLLLGKKLIVMAFNIGNVSEGQFDLLIPGGGVGIFNACKDILGTDLGEKFGGLLSTCENEVGYNYDDETLYTKRKECLINKCNSAFSGNDKAKKGCLFQANFLESAGNPLHTFKEVECPKVLKDRY